MNYPIKLIQEFFDIFSAKQDRNTKKINVLWTASDIGDKKCQINMCVFVNRLEFNHWLTPEFGLCGCFIAKPVFIFFGSITDQAILSLCHSTSENKVEVIQSLVLRNIFPSLAWQYTQNKQLFHISLLKMTIGRLAN